MRFLRKNRVKIAAAALVVGVVTLMALFIRAYNGGTTSAAPTFGPTTGLSTDSASADASSSSSAKPRSTATGIPGGGVTKYTFPNGQTYVAGDPGFFKFQNQHIVELRVFSGGNVRLIRVGWLAPESYDAPYGDERGLSSPWSITLHSSGTKYHAALFVGTDASGNPVTCQIFVDGVLKDQQTAHYPGARQVCVG